MLEPFDSDKKFEVYATLNLLLKDLTDNKKVTILSTYLSDITRMIKRDLSALVEKESNLDKDPFKTRVYVQIIKLLTILLSNHKIINMFWRVTSESLDFFKWAIQNSCLLIMRESISKNLLIANLQLLKDQRMNTSIPLPLQEKILFAILNFKTFNNSTSLVIEKLNILKQLIINFKAMMEKNSKNWLAFLFRCIMDGLHVFNLKVLQVSTAALLESCSHFLNSKTVNFEVTSLLNSDVPSIYTITNSNDASIHTTQVIFAYLTKKLSENLDLENSELIMVLWMSITLSYFSNPENLPQLSKPWLAICHKCFTLSESENGLQAEIAAINAWKGIVYVLANSEIILYSNDMIFKIMSQITWKKRTRTSKELDMAISQLFARLMFALTINRSVKDTSVSSAIKILISYFTSFAKKDGAIAKHTHEIISHVIQTRTARNGRIGAANNLYMILQTEPLNVANIDPLSAAMIFQDHEFYMNLFKKTIWHNDSVPFKLKMDTLSGLMAKIKTALVTKSIMERPNFQAESNVILLQYQQFINDYTERAKELATPGAKVDHFNRFTDLIRAHFGQRILQDQFCFYEMLIENAVKYDVRATEVLKFIVQQNRSFEYYVLGRVFHMCHENISKSKGPEFAKIVSYVGNNLESKIFMNDLTESEIISVLSILRKIPNKSRTLISNIMSMIATNTHKIVEKQESLITLLDTGAWSVANFFNLVYSIDTIKGIMVSAREAMRRSLISQIHQKLQSFNEEYTLVFFKELTELNISKLPDFPTSFFLVSNENFYYHLIDPKKSYKGDVFEKLYPLFKEYLMKLREICDDQRVPLVRLDGILSHGLNICYNLNHNLIKDQSERTQENKKLLIRVGEVHKLLFEVLKSIHPLDFHNLKQVNAFISSKRIESIDIDASNVNALLEAGEHLIAKTVMDQQAIIGVQGSVYDSVGANPTQVIEANLTDSAKTSEIEVSTEVIPEASTVDNIEDTSTEDRMESDDKPTQVIAEVGFSFKTFTDMNESITITENFKRIEDSAVLDNSDSDKPTQLIQEVVLANSVHTTNKGNDVDADSLADKATQVISEHGPKMGLQINVTPEKADPFVERRVTRSASKTHGSGKPQSEHLLHAEDKVQPAPRDRELQHSAKLHEIDDILVISKEEFLDSQKDKPADDDNKNNASSLISDENESHDIYSSVNSSNGADQKTKEIQNSNHEDQALGFTKSASIELTTVNEQSEQHNDTLEIPDSKSPMKDFNNLSSQTELSNSTDIDQSDRGTDEDSSGMGVFTLKQPTREINIDLPFSYSTLDSSPLRHRRRRTGKMTSLRESPIPLSPTPPSAQEPNVTDSIQVAKRRLEDNESIGSKLLGSPNKRGRYKDRQEDECEDPCSSPDIMMTLPSTGSKFMEVSKSLDTLGDDQFLRQLNNQEAYEIETKLLSLMLKLRESRGP